MVYQAGIGYIDYFGCCTGSYSVPADVYKRSNSIYKRMAGIIKPQFAAAFSELKKLFPVKYNYYNQ